jgi:hypothetical protein
MSGTWFWGGTTACGRVEKKGSLKCRKMLYWKKKAWYEK